MFVKSIVSFLLLTLLTLSVYFIPLKSHLIVFEFNLIGCLLFIYSLQYTKTLEIIGLLLNLISTSLILLANNPLSLICAWECSALSALIILSANYIKASQILRYATIHFVGGTLLLASIPYDLMLTELSSILDFLNNTQSTLLMIGILINCAVFPLSTWLTESYPYASPHGTAFLQVFVTKSALFILFQLFSGNSILVIIGFATAIYGLVFSLWRRKIREILAYNTIAQVGLLMITIGFGADIIPYLYSSIIYQTIMYLVASSVIYSTGKEELQELGGLFKKLPWLGLMSILSLCTMSALPLTISFNAKSILLSSITSNFLLVLFLVINSGIIISCGIRVVYFTFFGKKEYTDKIDKPKPYTSIPFAILTLLCFLPLAPVTSTYSTVKVIEQLSLFTGATILFYLLRTKWYNPPYKLITINCIYNLCISSLSRIKIKFCCHTFYNKTRNDITSFYQKIEKLNCENISFTILFALFIFGILVCII